MVGTGFLSVVSISVVSVSSIGRVRGISISSVCRVSIGISSIVVSISISISSRFSISSTLYNMDGTSRVSVVTGSLDNNRSRVGEGGNTGGVGNRGNTSVVSEGSVDSGVVGGVGVGRVGEGSVDSRVGEGSVDSRVDSGVGNMINSNGSGLLNDALHCCGVDSRDNGGGGIPVGVGVVVVGVVEKGWVSISISFSGRGSVGCSEKADLINKNKLNTLRFKISGSKIMIT